MTHTTRQQGKEGEDYVAKALELRGYEILARNYTKPYGEIDLIALKGDTLAFVEVKARTNIELDPALLITPSKQRKISMVAREYIARNSYMDKVCRFDVALLEKGTVSYSLTYIPNAFGA